MTFIPEIKYPDIINPIYLEDGSEWNGGYYFRTVEDSSKLHNTGKVLEIPCDDFDRDIHNSQANALFKKLVTLKGGSYIGIYLWCEGIDSTGPMRCLIRSFDADDNPTVIYSLNVLSGQGPSGLSFTCAPSDIVEYGMKLAYFTDYYDANHTPVPLVTEPYGFEFMLFFPNRAYSGGYGDWYNMMERVVSYSGVDWTNDSGAFPYTISFSRTSDVDSLFEGLEVTDGYGTSEPIDPDNPPPSQDDHPSDTGGGDGDYTGGSGSAGGYDSNSDPIDFPDLPVGGALSTGSVKGFLVTPIAINSIFNQLWNTSIFDVSTWQKLVESPLDSLISLHVLPFEPSTSINEHIHLGNFDFDDTIVGALIDNQYISIYGGSITLKPYWGSALDYSPYTKISIFLPFIGIRDLKPEDVVNMTLQVKYNIDVLTGDLVVFIKCGMSVLYKFNGNCRGDIPVTSKVFEGIANMFKGMATVGGGAAIAGALANPAIGVGSLLLAGVTTAMSKTQINRSGSITGVPGLLDDYEPYLIIHRPIQSLAKNFRKYKGYPCNITYTLSSLSGYTEVEYIHLKDIPGATSDEMAEIEKLLKEGVIL